MRAADVYEKHAFRVALTGHTKSQPKKNHFGNFLLVLKIWFCITFATLFFLSKNQKIVICADCSEKKLEITSKI